jgi:hypothetical protein
MNVVSTPSTAQFSNLQWQLLQLYKHNISESNLLEIKQLLSNYFAEKASSAMNNLWDEKGWTNETMKTWLEEDVHKKE